MMIDAYVIPEWITFLFAAPPILSDCQNTLL